MIPASRVPRPPRPRLADLAFHVQPIVGPDGRTPHGYEALVRWPQPDGTVRGPLDFLEGLLHGEAMVAFTRHGIVRLATLLAEHPRVPSLHLNLSPRQLALPVTEALLGDLRPSVRRRLRIELTEQRIADPSAYAASVRRLAGMGVRLVLDDVRPDELPDRLPSDGGIEGVKFDRTVLPDLLVDPDGPAARAARRLAARGFELTAEGIEEPGVLPALRALGVTRFQGFGLARPQPDLPTALAAFPPPADASREGASAGGTRNGHRSGAGGGLPSG